MVEADNHVTEMAYLVEMVKSFEDRSYPIFNNSFVENNTSELLFEKWTSLPQFAYDSIADECLDCTYKAPFKDLDRNYFAG